MCRKYVLKELWDKDALDITKLIFDWGSFCFKVKYFPYCPMSQTAYTCWNVSHFPNLPPHCHNPTQCRHPPLPPCHQNPPPSPHQLLHTTTSISPSITWHFLCANFVRVAYFEGCQNSRGIIEGPNYLLSSLIDKQPIFYFFLISNELLLKDNPSTLEIY